jgi:SAM-dependent methyltransferase
MDLKEIESGVDPKIHWYYQSKKVPLIDFVKKIFSEKKTPLTLIDIGSGSGFFMYELQEAIPEMIAKIYLVDIGYSDEEIAATANQHIEKIKSLPEKIENAIAVMMDVLEHLQDDHGMLNAIKEKSVGENYFFITVPAFMSLWSGHDVYLEHFRRYTIPSLRKLLHDSRFRDSQSLLFLRLHLSCCLAGKKNEKQFKI